MLPLVVVWQVRIPLSTKLSVGALMSLGLMLATSKPPNRTSKLTLTHSATGFGIARAASLGLVTNDLSCKDMPWSGVQKKPANNILRRIRSNCNLVQLGALPRNYCWKPGSLQVPLVLLLWRKTAPQLPSLSIRKLVASLSICVQQRQQVTRRQRR